MIQKTAYILIILIAIVVILSFGQSLIIPFVFALLLWFIVRMIRKLFDKIPFVKKRFPSWLKNLIPAILLIVVLGFASKVISTNINSLAQSYEKYEANVDSLIERAGEALGIDILGMIKGQTGDLDFGTMLSSIFDSLTEILGSTFMILLYGLFIFLEEAYFTIKLQGAFSKNNQFEKVSYIFRNIEKSVTKYLGMKTLISLSAGTASYIALAIVGIDSPVFWAFLISLMNFIPTIGALIGTLFPAIFCLLQFGEFGPGLMVLASVGTIQLLVGNILEPRLMGNSMNISALVTIFALAFWGAIWGVTGMILSVPITVITIIIFSEFPPTRPIAILLSEKGKIKDIQE
ncbi:MAG: AI-2E family transporter [Flavobacteriales bacterium]|nr:AI-2E family transporter [Flavobacteriales bacterium]